MDSPHPFSEALAGGSPVSEPRQIQPGNQEQFGDIEGEPPDELVLPHGWGERFQLLEGKAKEDHDLAIADDAELMFKLGLQGFQGALWHKTERRLVTYGRRVLPAKIRRGEIFVMMRALGIPGAADLSLPDKGPAVTKEEARDLADEVVARAIKPYKRVLMRGRWRSDMENAAQLTTYFVGQCCWQFRGPWRHYIRERRRNLLGRLAERNEGELTLRDEAQTHLDPSRAVIYSMEIERHLEAIPDRIDQRVVQLTAAGHSATEVGRELGLTPRQVEYRLKVIRKEADRRRHADSLREKSWDVA